MQLALAAIRQSSRIPVERSLADQLNYRSRNSGTTARGSSVPLAV